MLRLFVIGVAIIAVTFSEYATAQDTAATATVSGLTRLVRADSGLAPGEKIAFFGDSITMQGGYIQLIERAIGESEPTKPLGVKLLPHGLNGGRVPTVLQGKSPWGDLGAPMAELLQAEQPTIVVIYLGINDVWHGDQGTTPADFEAGLKEMIALCRQVKTKIVLCTPSVIGEEVKDNALNKTLGQYAELIRGIAKSEQLVLCDLHQAFLQKLESVNTKNEHQGHLTYDGVHMNEQGNGLIAEMVAGAIAEVVRSK